MQSAVIPSGFSIKNLRAGKGGKYTNKEIKDYCIYIYISIIGARQHQHTTENWLPGLVERNCAAMVGVSLAADCFLRGEPIFTVTLLGDGAPYSAINMESLYKVLHKTEPDLKLLELIGTRTFIHSETHAKNLECNAVERCLMGYYNNGESCCVYSPAARRILESRNVIFITTPSCLYPPLPGEARMQACGYGHVSDNKNYKYVTDATSFCVSLATTLRWRNSSQTLLSIPSPQAGIKKTCRWLNSWNGSEITRRNMLQK